MLFSKVMVMCLGSVQFKTCIQTCVNVSTPLVWVDGDIWLKARGWFLMHAAPWSTLTGRCVLLDRCITLWKYWFSNREACGTASELEIDLELTHFGPLCNRILCWVDQWLASFMGYVSKTVWQPVEGHMLCFWGFFIAVVLPVLWNSHSWYPCAETERSGRPGPDTAQQAWLVHQPHGDEGAVAGVGHFCFHHSCLPHLHPPLHGGADHRVSTLVARQAFSVGVCQADLNCPQR